jgi:hypothetical protein
MNFINIFNQTLTDSNILYLYNNPSYGQTTEGGLMTIGIENDSLYNDRITLWPNSGTGYVGINTKTPQATLDINGTLNINGIITNNSGSVGITADTGTVLTLKNTSIIGARSEVNIDFMTQTGNYMMARISALDTTVNTNGSIGGFNTSLRFYLGGTSFVEYMTLTSLGLNVAGITVGKGGASGSQDGRLAIGENALMSGTDATNGWYNTAIGANTLTAVANQNNTAVGAYALQNHTARHCTAVGAESLRYNTTGFQNTAVGLTTLYSNTTGSRNTAIGTSALYYLNGQTRNTAVGDSAGIGAASNHVGDNNTFIGASTYQNGTGYSNTYLGYGAFTNGTYNNSTAIGSGAEITASNQVRLGDANCTAHATAFNATSDYREKDNVIDLDETFTVDTLRPVVYDFKPLGKKHIGFIAHEVQEFYPYLVSGEKDGSASQSMNYNGLIGILTKEIQVLKKKVSDQEAKALAKAAEQDTRIQALEKMVFDLINK